MSPLDDLVVFEEIFAKGWVNSYYEVNRLKLVDLFFLYRCKMALAGRERVGHRDIDPVKETVRPLLQKPCLGWLGQTDPVSHAKLWNCNRRWEEPVKNWEGESNAICYRN
jgi:hypothetical protein